MPILACADKLKDEIKKFGTNFEGYTEEEVVPEQPPAPTQDTAIDPTKFSGQKSKAAAKTIKAKYQFQVGWAKPNIGMTVLTRMSDYAEYRYSPGGNSQVLRCPLLASILPASGYS
jgi:hypothetical protein